MAMSGCRHKSNKQSTLRTNIRVQRDDVTTGVEVDLQSHREWAVSYCVAVRAGLLPVTMLMNG